MKQLQKMNFQRVCGSHGYRTIWAMIHVLTISLVNASSASAFGGGTNFFNSYPVGDTCNVEISYVDLTDQYPDSWTGERIVATVRLVAGDVSYDAGGSSHTPAEVPYFPPITETALENCGLSGVTDLVQNGADGDVIDDDYIGFSFRLSAANGFIYSREFAISGVTNSTVIQSLDLVSTDDAILGMNVNISGSGELNSYGNYLFQVVMNPANAQTNDFDGSDFTVTNLTVESFFEALPVNGFLTYFVEVKPVNFGAWSLKVDADAFVSLEGVGNQSSNTVSGTFSDTDVVPVATVSAPADAIVETDLGQNTASVTFSEVYIDQSISALFDVTYSLDAMAIESPHDFPIGVSTVSVKIDPVILGSPDSFSSFTVTVEDNENPVISSLPADVIQQVHVGQSTAVVSWLLPIATDNDSVNVVATHEPGEAFPVGLTTVNYIAIDPSGNAANSSFEIEVTVSEIPILTPPETQVIALNESATTAALDVTGLGSVSDSSGEVPAIVYRIGPTIVAGSFDFPLGDTTVTMDATDSDSNAAPQVSFVVRVVDNIAPTVTLAGTPGFPGDSYPINIAFSEPSNGFVAADITADGAAISGFVNTCASDPCAAFSAVVTPAADRVFNHSISIAAGVAADAAGNDNLAATPFSPAAPDGVAPVVTITGMPDGFTGPTTATLTFEWGEDVFGFEDADITVIGGTLGAITGGRQRWTAELSVAGTSDVTVTLAAGAVQDNSGTASVAANATGKLASSAIAEAVIRDFMVSRAASLIAAQPNLRGLLDNTATGGTIAVSRGAGEVQIHTGSTGPVWAAVNANWSNLEGFETAYTNLSFGTHMSPHDEMLLGVMLQLDHAASAMGLSEITGTGWLLGPYYVARHGGLDVDARLLWGQAENEISSLGTYTDSFRSERMLATLNLSGTIETARATLRPLVGWTYTQDRSDAYIDALGNPIAKQAISLSELEVALDWTMPLGDGDIDFIGGIAGHYAAQHDGKDTREGTRGRIDLGLTRQGAGPFSFDVGVFVDGIGQASREQHGLNLSVNWQF